jgi:AcrR family transcriptional regulator
MEVRVGRRRDIDGRQLILSAALKLFAAHGVEGVSIRAVNREAGLGPASVHYHFGTKEALVDAVLHAYGDTVIEAVKARARKIAEMTGPLSARDLVTMLAEPYLLLISGQPEEGHAWVRLVSQLLQSDPDRILDRPSARSTWNAAARVYPDAAPADVKRAVRMCFSLLVNQLALHEPSRRRRSPNGMDLDLLVDFLSGGLDAALRTPDAGRRTADSRSA